MRWVKSADVAKQDDLSAQHPRADVDDFASYKPYSGT
jgi:hypothetical protein